MSADSALRDQLRAAVYKSLAVAFSYPNEALPAFYPQCSGRLGELQAAYDRTFRAGDVWLYGAEHAGGNEFQRVAALADVMGFYRAFGVKPGGDRPDALCCELEFMHYLIVKRIRLGEPAPGTEAEAKAAVCRDAERKFFAEHLAPTARGIAAGILKTRPHPFYTEAAEALGVFLDREQRQLVRTAA
ncbi:MAG: molecular chaperone TorD family protein [Thermoguttaceae bacterium]|jgi:TorA maturation chaperone TorD|nr:molecular chaperone TorD family protein [Thermoguttaceae bacterium]